METFNVLKTTWKELEDLGYTSVTDYCRMLIAEKKPIPDRIEIYRGEMLCMTVTSVTEAAKIEPSSKGWRKYRPTRSSKGRGFVNINRELP